MVGNIRYLTDTVCEDGMDLFSWDKFQVCVDAGAYRGESSVEMLERGHSIKRIYALEPDAKSYKKLCEFAQNESRVLPVNCGAWSKTDVGCFSEQGNRNSSFSNIGNKLTKLDKIDTIIGEDVPDYIKLDVEGCESEALDGCRDTIIGHHPSLLVCVYHRSCDIFTLINKICNEYPAYNVHLRRKKYVPAWDVYICAIENGGK